MAQGHVAHPSSGSIRVAMEDAGVTAIDVSEGSPKRDGREESPARLDGLEPPPRILIVEDDAAVATFLSRLLVRCGCLVDIVTDGRAAIEHLAGQLHDLALVDIGIPNIDGVNVCRRAKEDPVTRLIPIVLISGNTSWNQHMTAIAAGASALLPKPVDRMELVSRISGLVRMKRYTDDLEPAAAILMTLATLIETDKGYSEGHCHRMANCATALGRRLGLSSPELHTLYRGSFLHDIGMLAVPRLVIEEPRALTERELSFVRAHTTVGESFLSNLRSMQAVRPIVRSHHERLDGSGYPDGLIGDRIPVAAQIVGMIDAFEAMTSPRPYQATKSAQEAVDVLKLEVQRGWRRADLLEHFARIVEERRGQPDTAPEGVPEPEHRLAEVVSRTT